MIRANADVNMLDRDGWTSLNHAAWKGDLAIVKFLLNASADKTIQTYDGSSAIELAIARGHTKIVSGSQRDRFR